ncbi:hypothetical protein [Streptomyces glaucus]|uniref:Secreted protein n=1 Tax=Streptomyces glaucus TaxID=284029 RepID=A0ABN3J8L0_9ACTN
MNRHRVTLIGMASAIVAIFVLLLLWVALSLAVRASVFGFTGELDVRQFTASFTLFGAVLTAAATVFGALLTHEHNKNSRRRQNFEAVIKSLEALPSGTQQRVAGVLATTVLLGQPRVAIRVLEPAWKSGQVDSETATWIIDEILLDAESDSRIADGGRALRETVDEAAVILEKHARDLTDPKAPGVFSFLGHYMHGWSHRERLSREAKLLILQSMGEVLLSQRKDWWFPHDQLSDFPAAVWRDCVSDEAEDDLVRASAAVLLDGLCDCFPEGEYKRVGCKRLIELLESKRIDVRDVGPEFHDLAEQISREFKEGEKNARLRTRHGRSRKFSTREPTVVGAGSRPDDGTPR